MSRVALSALVGAQRVLSVQLCYAMPDGDFVVLPKANAYLKSKTAKAIAFDLYRIWVPNMMESRVKRKNEFELVVFGQIQSHIIRLSDLGSRNSQIQIRYTSNTMPI